MAQLTVYKVKFQYASGRWYTAHVSELLIVKSKVQVRFVSERHNHHKIWLADCIILDPKENHKQLPDQSKPNQ